MKHAVKHIHFVGVGGAGMSGIAEVLRNLGYAISGSDLADSPTLRRLEGLGIKTYLGHAASHVIGADAVVTSTAVQADNPEVLAARELLCVGLEKLGINWNQSIHGHPDSSGKAQSVIGIDSITQVPFQAGTVGSAAS